MARDGSPGVLSQAERGGRGQALTAEGLQFDAPVDDSVAVCGQLVAIQPE